MFVRSILGISAAAMIATIVPASAQSGFAFDPIGGVFRPMPAQTKATATATATPQAVVARAGRYEATVNITVKSSLPTNTKPRCTLTVGHFGPGTSYQETGTTVATGAGASWGCTVIIPYSWGNASTSSPVTLSLMVTGGSGATGRTHFRILPPAQLPRNNAATRLSYDVTL